MSLRVEKLTKDFPTPTGSLSVLRDAELSMSAGDAVSIMGPSGSGKSTLLYILGTLDEPTSGDYSLQDVNPFKLSEHELADFRNANIGFIFQDHHLLPQCSVLENVLIPTLVSQGDPTQSEHWARELIERVGLADRIDHRPAELSGGERQRVGIARSLINRPKLLLADEPTGNLDQKIAHDIGELLVKLHEQEQTMLVVVTHSVELADLFPRRLKMDDGKLEERS